jgi:hypothetical protein
MLHKRVCEPEAGRATNSTTTTTKKPRLAHGGIDSSRPAQVPANGPNSRDKRPLEHPNFIPNFIPTAIATVREQHKRPRSSGVQLNGLAKESYALIPEPAVLSRLESSCLSGTGKRSHLSDDSTAHSFFGEISAGRSGSSSPRRTSRCIDPIESFPPSSGRAMWNAPSAPDNVATCPTAGIDGPLAVAGVGTVDNQPTRVYERSLCSLFVQDLLISTLLDEDWFG